MTGPLLTRSARSENAGAIASQLVMLCCRQEIFGLSSRYKLFRFERPAHRRHSGEFAPALLSFRE